MKLSKFLDRQICPESFNIQKPKKIEINGDIIKQSAKTIPARFELEIFKFLFQNKRGLGIKKIYQLRNSSIDGLIILNDDDAVAIEIKYRMGWLRACQTGWQFEQFFRKEIAKEYNPKIGIVLFENFSIDWLGKALSRNNVDGWNYWYSYHHYLPGKDNFTIHLLQFCDGKLYGYPS